MSVAEARVEDVDLDGSMHQFVTFYLEDGQFGVPLSDVQEIIRVPDLVRVPLAPPALMGIANLRGMVLPVASLRTAFHLEERATDDAMRVVVVKRGVTMGILVDRMSSVMTVDESQIDEAVHLRDASQSDLIEKVVKQESGRVMIFDPIRVLEEIFDVVQSDEETGGHRSSGKAPGTGEGTSGLPTPAERQLVSFEVHGQEYAFAIDRVKEIVTLPEEVTSVPKTPSAMLGVMVLRDEVLPLVSLRGLIGLAPPEEDLQQRVVVTTGLKGGRESTEDASEGQAIGDFAVGVVVDTVREVLRVPETVVDPVPPILAAGADELEAVCRLDGGKRIVTILDAEGLLDFEMLERELEEALEDSSMNVEASTAEQVGDIEEQLVIFRLRDETYGIPVEVVQEIVRVPDDMTAVPRAPGFVEGIINLRGDVLPVIDQRRRFDLETAERNDRQRIVVLNLRDHRLGFIVDSVAEVRKIPGHVIGPAPTLSDAQARIIRRVANLEDRGLVLLLEPEQLVSTSEMDALGGL